MLVLVRNGEMVSEAENRNTGQTNSPLTPLGIEQTRELRDTMGGYKYDAVFVSDQEACQDTTWNALGHSHPRDSWDLSEELRERSGGTLEGKTYQEIRKDFSPKYYKLWERDFFESPPMGESFRDTEDRVIPFFKEYVIPLVNTGKNVWICTHEIPMKILVGYIKGLDEADIMKLPVANGMPFVLNGNIEA